MHGRFEPFALVKPSALRTHHRPLERDELEPCAAHDGLLERRPDIRAELETAQLRSQEPGGSQGFPILLALFEWELAVIYVVSAALTFGADQAPACITMLTLAN